MIDFSTFVDKVWPNVREIYRAQEAGDEVRRCCVRLCVEAEQSLTVRQSQETGCLCDTQLITQF